MRSIIVSLLVGVELGLNFALFTGRDALPLVVRAQKLFGSFFVFSHNPRVILSQSQVDHGEVWIQLERALQQEWDLSSVASCHGIGSLRIELQSLERTGRDLGEGPTGLLDSREGFAQILPYPFCQFIGSVEELVLLIKALPFSEKQATVGRVHCPHCDLKDVSDVLDAAGEQHVEVFPLADFPSQRFVNTSYILLLHPLQNFVDARSWVHIYVWRL